MNKTIGTLGFIFLVTSVVFIDTPIIWVFAFPFSVTGLVLVLMFYLRQIKKSKNKLARFMIISGVVILWILLAYAANAYCTYLVSNLEQLNWIKILVTSSINLLASVLIFMGMRKASDSSLGNLIIMVIPTFLMIPLTMILIKIYFLSNFWLGSIAAS